MAIYDMNYYEEMKKAEAGDLDAMFNVASYIIWSDAISSIEPEAAEMAIRYYEANAEAGDSDAMLDLGGMYIDGRGVKKDKEKALMWYERAAALNGPRACRCIGNLYKYDVIDDGTPIPTADPVRLEKALEWYKTGAEREEENCLYELGDYYRKGLLVEKDEKKALELYLQAYEICCKLVHDKYAWNDSYSDVCFRLSECYHYGVGTEVNLEKAKDFAEIAKKEAKARMDRGDMYGGYLYPIALREWQAIMAEIGF